MAAGSRWALSETSFTPARRLVRLSSGLPTRRKRASCGRSLCLPWVTRAGDCLGDEGLLSRVLGAGDPYATNAVVSLPAWRATPLSPEAMAGSTRLRGECDRQPGLPPAHECSQVSSVGNPLLEYAHTGHRRGGCRLAATTAAPWPAPRTPWRCLQQLRSRLAPTGLGEAASRTRPRLLPSTRLRGRGGKRLSASRAGGHASDGAGIQSRAAAIVGLDHRPNAGRVGRICARLLDRGRSVRCSLRSLARPRGLLRSLVVSIG